MTVKLVSNLTGATHQALLKNLVFECQEAVFASPYLYDDFEGWLDSVDFGSVKRVTLLTTLAPKGDDQLRKPKSLLSLVRGIRRRWPDLQLIIQIDNKLHGKIYLFKRRDVLTDGIITSANLTFSGLSARHEWGVHVTDIELLNQLKGQMDSVVEYPFVSEELLERMEVFVDQYLRDNPKVARHADIDASLFNALKMAAKAGAANAAADISSTTRFFLKPWGTKEEPIRRSERRDFGDEQGSLDFPKGKPGDVRMGDIVITFGTGARSVLSVHKTLGWPEERTESQQRVDEHARRWPWFIFAQNLTPKFGGKWWEHDLTIDSLAEEFMAREGLAITSAGGTSLGAFQFGAGRLKLSQEFGHYVLDRIMAVEKIMMTS